ncbi:DnaD domain protein [Fusibacter bizertensis]|uniref:DnaD domain protein n=1 Tax=Fusibacter bizertensis TaxID=1488331 RepID=A0ABT6NDI8_9FIRM|nr:DnaD domain protein [Fusibacter bizertensis]MDH8678489.1 DnaD domain protein [Fusibacter bizertensis]
MGFYKKTPDFDLGELNIENIFITDFMPSASGTFVKIYLLAQLFSRDENTKFHYDNRTLASMLSLPVQDVHEAWNYWEKLGLVNKHPHEESADYDIEFLSLRGLYIDNNYVHKNNTSSKAKQKPKEPNNTFKSENESFQKLTKEIETIIGHPLTYKDYREIGDYYEHYTRNPQIICKAFSHCYKDRGIRSLKLVKSTLLQWLDQGLNSIEAIDTWLNASEERQSLYKDILKMLGIGFRQPNQAEKDFMDKWLDQYGFEKSQLMQIVLDLSKKTLNINFNFIDKVLTTQFQSGNLTFEAYSSSKATPEKSESKPNKRKNFTIEKENTYSEEELEQILLGRKK